MPALMARPALKARPALSARPALTALPAPAALLLGGLGGVASAAQSAANGTLGERVGSAPLAAMVNNLGGCLILLVGLALMPSMRTGLRMLPRTGLPWWAYLGGLGGGFFVAVAAYAVPVLGVAVFTIAQVAGNSFAGLGVDRAGLGPAGRLPVTPSRLAGAVLGVAAVGIAQAGRPVGELALGLLALAIAGGVAIALQSALNGRVSAASSSAAATAVNFAVSTPPLALLAAAVGAFGRHWPGQWPGEWYLYIGGALGVVIVTILVVSVRSVGVLRTGLAVVAGQLAGALGLDALTPGGAGVSPALVAGAMLTVAAVVVTGRGVRSAPLGT
jgi:transporter family-2 protein